MDYVSERMQEIAKEIADSALDGGRPVAGYKNVQRDKTRHGKPVTYYRVGNGKRIRLPNRDEVSEEAFAQAYLAAQNGTVRQKPRRAKVEGKFGPPGKPGFVYFLRDATTVKIGFTTSIRQRIKAIQTGCAEPVELLMVMPGTDETEKFFHALFRDFRIGGEWFSLTGLLAEFVGYRAK